MSADIIQTFEELVKTAETHTVQPGDTFDIISKTNPVAISNDIIVQEIIDANPKVNPTSLQIGDQVVIPTGSLLKRIREKRKVPGMGSGDRIKQIDKAFSSAASKHGVSEAILRGIAMVESAGNVCAVSGAGAQGLMQLMPQIQRAYGVADPMDPVSSIWGAAAHLSKMMAAARQIIKYRPDYSVEKVALTMYNLGESAYRAAVRGERDLPVESAEYAGKVLASAGARPNYHCNKKPI